MRVVWRSDVTQTGKSGASRERAKGVPREGETLCRGGIWQSTCSCRWDFDWSDLNKSVSCFCTSQSLYEKREYYD